MLKPMKLIIKLFTILFIVTTFSVGGFVWVQAVDDNGETLQAYQKGTFEEYVYNISWKMFEFKQNFWVKGIMQKADIDKLKTLINSSFDYLPDNNLKNQNLRNAAITSLRKGEIYNSDTSVYAEIIDSVSNYVDNVTIWAVKGDIYASPEKGAGPLTVTLRWDVREPNGMNIPDSNYVWYINTDSGISVIGRWRIVKKVFSQEWYIDVFLAVKSPHVNSKGKTDVKNFGSRVSLEIKEPSIYFNIKVNNERVREDNVLKFTPAEASRGLIFDATSSTPNKWREFIKTEWDFWNGVEKEYDGDPRIETVKYNKEGRFEVRLKLRTNEWDIVTKEFDIEINDPIAHVKASKDSGYIGDTITFSSKLVTGEKDEDLLFNWKIIDIENDKVIYQSTDSLITYTFKNKGRFNVQLFVTGIDNEEDYDNQIIDINSRAPVAKAEDTIPFKNKPNTVFLDWTMSYDPDYTDKWKLRYIWTIDWEEAELTDPAGDNSTGYYTFNEVWNHNITLEVIDPDDISNDYSFKVEINSVLSVDFSAYPRVIKVWESIEFRAISPNASFYEWSFGDWETDKWANSTTRHTFSKSWEYFATLKVLNNNGQENSYSKKIYVAPGNSPFSILNVDKSWAGAYEYSPNVCNGSYGYIVDRVNPVIFSGTESVNVNGLQAGLEYSWKIDTKFYDSASVSYKFDEVGCFPVKLTVRDTENGVSNSSSTYIRVDNLKPELTSISIVPQNLDNDPVVVDVTANNAKDKDWVIQSYLWYYYTDTDSEPQAFRATSNNRTSFVLPKITWNYYFVLVMKDNNGEKTTTDSRDEDYFITLEWNNINTPILTLSANNTSVLVWDEVVFKAWVKNILGQDLSKDSEYFWDFDGDWIYDKETKTSSTSYVFEKSGSFKAKVKVRYKWISNTRTKQIDVANKLYPDFEYFSIWNTVVLLDKSTWTVEQYKFDLWDGTSKTFPWDYLVHTYSDDKKIHNVTLTIQEGTKVKNIKKEVNYSALNKAITWKDWIHIFSEPNYNSKDSTIVVSKERDWVLMYLGQSKGDFAYYGIDYNLDEDSNLNWEPTDDIDNKDTKSFTTWEPVNIPLNSTSREQKVRIFLLKDDWKTVVYSTDITILKEYIEDTNLTTIKFEWISDSDALIIEKIKANIELLPKNNRLELFNFIKQLEAGWFDEREKTEVILNFGNYVSSIEDASQDVKSQIYKDLETLLVWGEQDKNTLNVSYSVIKNILPTDMEEYDRAIEVLEEISTNRDVEANRALWKEFLGYISKTTKLSVDDKITIKDQLKILIYDNKIVDWEDSLNVTDEDIKNEEKPSSSISSKIIGVLKFLWIILFVIFWWIFICILVFYIIYRVTNKDPNLGFQDFIIDKTYWKSEDDKSPLKNHVEDELSELLDVKPSEIKK